MGSVKLSDTTVAALICPPGRKDIMFLDAALKGFGLRVTPGGAKVFLFQYRVGNAVRRHRLGEWPTITVAKARKAAEGHRGAVGGGGDPAAERRAKAAAEGERKALAKATAAADAFTFGKLVDGWETTGLAHRRQSYREDATNRVRIYFAALLDRPAAKLVRGDVLPVIDQVERVRGMVSARRGLSYARAAFGWAVKRDLVEGNPFEKIAAPGKETARERVLTVDELRAIWRAASTMEGVAGAYLRVLLLTLQRREEVARMRWVELSADRSTWTVPADRAKNGKAHLVHLAEPVRVALAGLHRLKGNPHVFPGRRGGSIGGFSHMKDELLRVMAGAVPIQPGRRRAKAPDSVAADWRFHDFRRTGVTMLANLGVAPHVADKLLNHVTGTIQGVAAVYQRAEFLAERKAALEAWAAHVTRADEADGNPGNVIHEPG